MRRRSQWHPPPKLPVSSKQATPAVSTDHAEAPITSLLRGSEATAGATDREVAGGNGDNEGTIEERLARCAEACFKQQTPQNDEQWGAHGPALGFGMTPNDGRCYCNHVQYSSCPKKYDSYTSYEYQGPSLCMHVTTSNCESHILPSQHCHVRWAQALHETLHVVYCEMIWGHM